MAAAMRWVLVVAMLASSGCVRRAVTRVEPAAAAAEARGPSHPATLPAQWAELEASARASVAAGRPSIEIGEAVTVAERGTMFERSIEVEGGWCYVGAVAWGFDRQACVSAGSPMVIGGEVGRQSFFHECAAGPVMRFEDCVDVSGALRVTGRVLEPGSTETRQSFAHDEQLDFVIVLGRYREARGTARRRQEREAASTAAGLERADREAAAMAAEDAARFRERCQPCRDEYDLCRLARARSGDRSQRCEHELDRCAGDLASRLYLRVSDPASLCGR
jgi:hypothetical protein